MVKGIVYGIVGAVIYDKVIKDRLHIYKWECPDPACHYRIWTNKQARMDRDILQHREEHV